MLTVSPTTLLLTVICVNGFNIGLVVAFPGKYIDFNTITQTNNVEMGNRTMTEKSWMKNNATTLQQLIKYDFFVSVQVLTSYVYSLYQLSGSIKTFYLN